MSADVGTNEVSAESSLNAVLSPRLRDLKDMLIEAIPCASDEKYARDELAGQPLEEVIKHYMTWVDRTISARPRRVTFARDFWSAALPPDVVSGLATLMQLFSTGGNLGPYLSRYVNTHGYVRKPDKPRKGPDWSDSGKGAKDFAVNVYDVHHLHFTPILQSRRRGPSDPLLFVNVYRDHVHFLLVGNHKSFDSDTLRQRVAASRKDRGLVVKTQTPAQDGAAPRNVGGLLRSGINTLETFENQLVPLGMVMADGASMWMRMHVDEIMMTLADWDHRLDTPTGRQELAEAMGVAADLEGAQWQFSHGDLCLVDQHGSAYLLSKWIR